MNGESNLLKKILMIGITAIVAGIVLISPLFSNPSVDINSVNSVLMWVIILLLSVIAAATEDVTSELKAMAKNQIEELRLLKAEIVLLRHDSRLKK